MKRFGKEFRKNDFIKIFNGPKTAATGTRPPRLFLVAVYHDPAGLHEEIAYYQEGGDGRHPAGDMEAKTVQEHDDTKK